MIDLRSVPDFVRLGEAVSNTYLKPRARLVIVKKFSQISQRYQNRILGRHQKI